MLLLVSGASGTGKSTVRQSIARTLSPDIDCVEFGTLPTAPAPMTLADRQRETEALVRFARASDIEGRHVLFCGDPVAPGEVLAAPSADGIAIAICLLDADASARTERLAPRGPDPNLVHNLAFGDWLREHAKDPTARQHVLTDGGWPPMEWDRWMSLEADDARWAIPVIDASHIPVDTVAALVTSWAHAAIRREAPVFEPGWSVSKPRR